MARYTGPSTRIARKFGEAIFGDDKAFEKRNYPPGQHGMAKKRGKKGKVYSSYELYSNYVRSSRLDCFCIVFCDVVFGELCK